MPTVDSRQTTWKSPFKTVAAASAICSIARCSDKWISIQMDFPFTCISPSPSRSYRLHCSLFCIFFSYSLRSKVVSFRFVFLSRSRLINSFGIFLRFSFFARCASWTRDGDGEATLSRGFFITWENNCTPFAVATLKYLWWRWQQQHAIIYGLWCY